MSRVQHGIASRSSFFLFIVPVPPSHLVLVHYACCFITSHVMLNNNGCLRQVRCTNQSPSPSPKVDKIILQGRTDSIPLLPITDNCQTTSTSTTDRRPPIPPYDALADDLSLRCGLSLGLCSFRHGCFGN